MAVLIPVLVGLALGLLVWQVTWLSARLERLTGRVTAARAGLDAQLVRRAAAVQALVDSDPAVFGARAGELRALCHGVLGSDDASRESVENDLGRALTSLPPGGDADLRRDLGDAGERVVLARRFYNDAVRDTLALRGRPIPRLLGLSRRVRRPEFFEIADAVVPHADGREGDQAPEPGENPPQ